jgi:hypothetical protein
LANEVKDLPNRNYSHRQRQKSQNPFHNIPKQNLGYAVAKLPANKRTARPAIINFVYPTAKAVVWAMATP